MHKLNNFQLLATKRALIIFMGCVTLFVVFNMIWMLHGESAVETDETWQRIQQQNFVIVGVDVNLAPYGIYDPSGPRGIDPDIARAIGKLWDVEVHFSLVNYDGMYDSLLVGDVDILIAGVRPEPRRAAASRYTEAYFDSGYVLVSTTGSQPTLEEIQGKILGVVFATDGDIWAQSYLEEHPNAFTLQQYDDTEQLLSALNEENIVYALLDKVSAHQAHQQYPHLSIADEPLLSNPLVMVVRRSDWKLYAELQRAIKILKANGTIDEIIQRWL